MSASKNPGQAREVRARHSLKRLHTERAPRAAGGGNGEPISLQHPDAALTVLEADQLVAAKQRTRFGRRRLSLSARALLWGLRLYVVIMLAIVFLSVLRALHGGR
jgi:hypothetical protein